MNHHRPKPPSGRIVATVNGEPATIEICGRHTFAAGAFVRFRESKRTRWRPGLLRSIEPIEIEEFTDRKAVLGGIGTPFKWAQPKSVEEQLAAIRAEHA